VAPVVVGVVGFGAAGPVAGKFPRLIVVAKTKPLEPIGSLAATAQAGIGNVVAGSAFATVQSMAMGGGVPAVVSALGGMAAGVAGAAIAAVALKQ